MMGISAVNSKNPNFVIRYKVEASRSLNHEAFSSNSVIHIPQKTPLVPPTPPPPRVRSFLRANLDPWKATWLEFD